MAYKKAAKYYKGIIDEMKQGNKAGLDELKKSSKKEFINLKSYLSEELGPLKLKYENLIEEQKKKNKKLDTQVKKVKELVTTLETMLTARKREIYELNRTEAVVSDDLFEVGESESKLERILQ